MGGPTICAEVLKEDLICKPCVFNKSYHKESCTPDVGCASGYMRDSALCPLSLDNSSVLKKDEFVQVLGIALKGILHIHDTVELIGNNSSSDEEALVHPSSEVIVEVQWNAGSPTNSQLLINEEEESLSIQSESQTLPDEPSLTRTTAKVPVSAMKGSRERVGVLPKMKLAVTWAPDVYEPPVTSSSHTVKAGYRHRAKVQKNHHKHKHVKGRHFRGGSEKKHKSHRSTYSDPRMLRNHDPADRFQKTGFDQSNKDLWDHEVVSNLRREVLPLVV